MEDAELPRTEQEHWGKGTRDSEERLFLSGPSPRGLELASALRIFREIIRGFRALHFVGPCVTVFGSARFQEGHPAYIQCRELGAQLARAGFTVMTGGGPGLMEAANRGAKDVGGRSVGCNITLPTEQKPNPYLDTFVEFSYFFVRKLMLAKYSYAFIAVPGGFGTLDELFEVLVLIQTGKMRDFPVVLLGKNYWEPLWAFARDKLLPAGAVDPLDVDRVLVTDSVEEAVSLVRERGLTRFGLSYGPKAKRRWFLGE
jgi:uncharacterized protein (TIGR00730 family)